MKKTVVILIFLNINCILLAAKNSNQSYLSLLKREKSSFLTHFKKIGACLKGGKKCTPEQIRHARIISAAFIGLLMSSTAALGAAWYLKKPSTKMNEDEYQNMVIGEIIAAYKKIKEDEQLLQTFSTQEMLSDFLTKTSANILKKYGIGNLPPEYQNSVEQEHGAVLETWKKKMGIER